jgi:hypothetical protein
MSTRTNEQHLIVANTIISQTGAGGSDEELEVGRRFLAALAARDYDGLEACFQADVNFRALVPSGIREGVGPQVTVAWLRRWFDEADLFDMQKMNLDMVVDRLHITYRIQVREEGIMKMVEQEAYCVVGDGLITDMRLLCSGFRPETTA